MNKYMKLIAMSFKENTVYRSKVILYIIGGLIQVFMYYYIWNAVFDNGGNVIGGYSRLEFITYIIVSFSLSGVMPSSVSNALSKDVRTGDIVSLMTKPISIDYYYLFYNIGDGIITGIFMGLPLFIIGYFYLGVMLPYNILTFIISLALGFVVVFYLNFIIGQLSFFTTSVVGIVIAYQSVSMFLSGSIVPLSLLPGSVRTVIEVLPFKSGFSIPLNIYLGKISGEEVVYNILFQVMWIFILKFLSDRIYKLGLEKNSILGG
ncbi:ABC transporter permease [Clostridium cylindrosporum]|uniref:ABC-2 family transporter protein n=1 Tax=Clostridium cylindrosporum DSM 605 TaxID=1121307 RepID=A0A0J8D775_CLOCY|nr:ABC-2 family transporter protein [Clostridium cylindrosporum]KMT21920.1 hypothetical protein CLCY_3c01910 [Clostridium cylindrosporum DSM 605]